MSAIETKRVVEAAVRLGTMIDAHARDAGRQLGERLRPWLRDGETLPDFTLALELIARLSRETGHRVRERENRLDDATSDEAEARLRRNQTALALRRKLVDVRRLLILALGTQRIGELLRIEGDTAKSSQPELLLSQADACLSLLRDPQRLRLPSARRFFDPAETADDLEPLITALRQARDGLDKTHRESARQLETRNRTRTELENNIRSVGAILGGWFRLIRRHDLAKKIRPVQRPGRA